MPEILQKILKRIFLFFLEIHSRKGGSITRKLKSVILQIHKNNTDA